MIYDSNGVYGSDVVEAEGMAWFGCWILTTVCVQSHLNYIGFYRCDNTLEEC